MIPKRIIYCWFGGNEMSDLNKRCMETWHEKCPDYEIVRVDESNFDPSQHEYSKSAYEHGNWSFVSDVARITVLRRLGGFYLDTDVELFKSLDVMRNHRAVCTECGRGFWNTAILGLEEGFFPHAFKVAYDNLGPKKAIHTNLTYALYDEFNLLGDSYSEHGGIGMYGVEYVAGEREPVTERTIAKHHEENTWTKAWLNGYEIGADFVPFVINGGEVDGSRFYGDREPIGTLTLKDGIEMSVDVAELGNYFMNPRVNALYSDDFTFERYGGHHGQPKTLDTGYVLWHD